MVSPCCSQGDCKGTNTLASQAPHPHLPLRTHPHPQTLWLGGVPETSQFWSLTTPDMCMGNVVSHVMDRSSALFGKPAEDAGATAIAGLSVWPRTGPYDLTEAGRVHS